MFNESENKGGPPRMSDEEYWSIVSTSNDVYEQNEVGDRPLGPPSDAPPTPGQHPTPQDKNAHQEHYSPTPRDVQQQESDVEAQQQKEGEPPHEKKKKKKKKSSDTKEKLQSKVADKHNSSSMPSHQQKDPSGRILQVLTDEEKRLSKDADRSSGREGGDLKYCKKEPKIDGEVAGLMAAQHPHEHTQHSEMSEEKDVDVATGINEHEWEDDEIPYDSFSMLYVAENWIESVMPL